MRERPRLDDEANVRMATANIVVRYTAAVHDSGDQLRPGLRAVRLSLEHRNRSAQFEEHTEPGAVELHNAGDGGQGIGSGHTGLQSGESGHLCGGATSGLGAARVQLYASA